MHYWNLGILGLLIMIAGLSGCASMSGLQDGRTVGQGNGEFAISVDLTQTPDFDSEDEEGIPSFYVPIIELGGRFGISEKADIGLRVNSGLNFLMDGKYQFLGDQESEFACSVGAGFGVFGFAGIVGLYNFQVPVYASYHPRENVSVYVSPRYIGQFGTSFAKLAGMMHYLGTNAGFLSGSRTKFGVDFGVYRVSNSRTSVSEVLFQFGGGVKFTLGRENKRRR